MHFYAVRNDLHCVLCSRAWLKEMLSLVRGEPQSVKGSDLEQLIKKHDEYRVQIDRQLSKSQATKQKGKCLIEDGNFMSEKVTLPHYLLTSNT